MSREFYIIVSILVLGTLLNIGVGLSKSLPVQIHGYRVGLKKLGVEVCRILTNTVDTRTLNDVKKGVLPVPTKCL